MEYVVRSPSSRVNQVVGPLVMVLGVLALITAVILSVAMGTPAFLALLVPAALGLGGGAFVLWGARRSRLRIDGEGFRWAGFVGAEQAVRWQDLDRLVPPPPGDRRTVAIARLRDGTEVAVRALWEPATVPAMMSGGPDHSRVQDALIAAHRTWLAGRR